VNTSIHTNSIQQYDDNFNDFVEFKARLIILLITEGQQERAVARLEALQHEYGQKHYEAVKAKVAELLR